MASSSSPYSNPNYVRPRNIPRTLKKEGDVDSGDPAFEAYRDQWRSTLIEDNNPILSTEGETADEMMINYYVSRTEEFDEERSKVILQYANAYFKVWSFSVDPQYVHAVDILGGRIKLDGISKTSAYYVAFLSLYHASDLDVSVLSSNARLQDRIRRRRRGGSSPEEGELLTHAQSLQTKIETLAMLHEYISKIAIPDRRTQSRQSDLERNAEQLTTIEDDSIENYNRDLNTITQWIDSDKYVSVDAKEMQLWTDEIVDFSSYDDDALAIIRERINYLLSEESPFQALKIYNETAKRVAFLISKDRAIIAAIDAINKESGASSSSSSSKRGRTSSSSSISTITDLQTEDIENIRRTLAKERASGVQSIREATFEALNESLQLRKNLYEYLGFPELRSRELASLDDLPSLLSDLLRETETADDILTTIKYNRAASFKVDATKEDLFTHRQDIEQTLEDVKRLQPPPQNTDPISIVDTVPEEDLSRTSDALEEKQQQVQQTLTRTRNLELQQQVTVARKSTTQSEDTTTRARIPMDEARQEVNDLERSIERAENAKKRSAKAVTSSSSREDASSSIPILDTFMQAADAKRMQDLAQQLEDLRENLRSQQLITEESTSRYDDLVGAANKQAEEFKEHMTGYAALREEFKELQQKHVDETDANRQAAAQELQDLQLSLQNNIDALTRELGESNERYRELELEQTTKNEDYAILTQEQLALKDQITQLQEEADTLRSDIAKEIIKKEDFDRQLQESQVQLARLEEFERQSIARGKLIQKNTTEREKNEQTIADLRAQLTIERERATELEKAQEAAAKARIDLVQELDDTISTIENSNDKLTEAVDLSRRYLQQRNDARDKLRQIETNRDALDTQLEDLRQRYAQTDQEFRRIIGERDRDYEQLQEELNALNTRNSETIANVRRTYDQAVQEIQRGIDSLRAKHREKKSELEQTQKANSDLSKELKVLRREINENAAERQESQRTITTLNAQLRHIEESRLEINRLRETQEILENEAGVRDRQFINRIKDLEEQIDKETRDSRNILDKLRQAENEARLARAEVERLIASSPSKTMTTVQQPQYTPQDLGAYLQSKGLLPVQEQGVVEFDITAERERHRSIIDQLVVTDDSRAFDAMEDYILTSGDIDPSVFVVLDRFSVFVNMVEGATGNRQGAFWKSTNKSHKGIIRDIIDAASSEVEHSHILDVADFTNIQPVISSLLDSVLRTNYLDTLAQNPGDLFTPIQPYPPVNFVFSTTDDSLARKRESAPYIDGVLSSEKIFNTNEQLKRDYDFFNVARQYILPVLNQPTSGVSFSLASPDVDRWSTKPRNSSLAQVVSELSIAIVQHLHIREAARRRRRPTRLSVRKLLSDYLISNTLNNVHHSGILYTSTRDKIRNILVAVVHNGFLSAFDYCLNALRIPREFDHPLMYAALDNAHFADLVTLRYNCTIALTQSSRAQISTFSLQKAFSDKLDFFNEPGRAIQPESIPLPGELYSSDAPRTRVAYLSAVSESQDPIYKRQRARLRALRRRTIVS